MSEKTATELDTGPAVVRGYLNRVANLLARDMRDRAQEGGGSVGAADIDAVLAAFKRPDSPVLQAICDAVWEDCSAILESEGRREHRKTPFRRLMVWPFAHLLPDYGDPDGAPGTLSRRIIPGYMAALEDLVGPVVFGRQQERSRELVRAKRHARGGAFRWEEIVQDPHGMDIVDDMLVVLAGEFDDFERQRDWFIGLVNDAMPLPAAGSDHPIAFDDEGFGALMKALYSRLARSLATPEGKTRLLERHGEDAVEKTVALLARLDRR